MRFLLVGMSLLGLFHYYAWARWVRDPGWEPPYFWLLTAAVVAFWLSVPLTLRASRRFSPPVARLWAWPGYVWLGTVFLAPFVLALSDLTRVLLTWSLSQSPGPGEIAAGVYSPRSWASLSASVLLGLVAFSVWRARASPRVDTVRVVLSRLPAELHGLCVVQLSDVHVGLTLRRRFVRQIVDRVNSLEPDLVVITGDLVDGSVERLASEVEPLRDLRAKRGVFFVTGNHEYYSGAAEWCEHLETLGIAVLRNRRVSIGSGEASFDLAGIDDLSGSQHEPGHGADLEKALSDRDDSRELVLLAHQPRVLPQAVRAKVGLMISGHTHGGQIWPFSWLVPLQQPVLRGLERVEDTQIYVNRGTGYWGPPMRLGSPPEITRLVLEASREESC